MHAVTVIRGGEHDKNNNKFSSGTQTEQSTLLGRLTYHLHNNTLARQTTTVLSNDTLGNTPFQLISDFFHVNKVLSVLSMLSKLPPGVCWRGGGGGGQQAC